MHSGKETPKSQMGRTEAMENGSLCEAYLSCWYCGSALGKGNTERGRMIYQVVDGRPLKDFIVFYMRSCYYRLNR